MVILSFEVAFQQEAKMKVSNMTIDEISNLQRSIIARDYGKTSDKPIDFEQELEVMNTLADLTEIKIKLRIGDI